MFKVFLKIGITLTAVFSSLPVLASENFFPDGLFLYGQSSQLHEIGKEYLVFEVQQNRVKGAIYLPNSEFSCFEGKLTPQAMNLSIIAPDSHTVHPFQINLQHKTITASVTIPHTQVGLEGYYRLDHLHEHDRQILDTCLSE